MILFLGSGVSVPSKLPNVTEITALLLDHTYYRDLSSIGTYYSENNKGSQYVEAMPEVRQLLKMLGGLDADYLKSIAPYWSGSKFLKTGSIYRSTTSYEDLFYLIEQIKMCGIGLTDDAPTGAFVDLVELKAGNILKGESRDERLINLYHLSVEASGLIEWIVATSLYNEQNIGLDLVAELAQSKTIGQLDIVTLNHDTLVEQVLTKNNISFVDGFGCHDGEVRWQDDTVYDTKDSKVRLIKPHGSINWYRFTLDGNERYAMINGNDPTNCKNQLGERLKYSLKTPSFLSGANKIIAYNRSIFTDVFYRFHKALCENDLIVMSGYGWGDIAINFRIENWVDSRKNNRIIVLHENHNELIKRSLQLEQSYNGWVRDGKLIPVPKWLCNTSLNDLTTALTRTGNYAGASLPTG